MKAKIIQLALASLVVAVSATAEADGPPPGGSLQVRSDLTSKPVAAISYSGGAVTTLSGGKPSISPVQLVVSNDFSQALFTWARSRVSGAAGGEPKRIDFYSFDATGNGLPGIEIGSPRVAAIDFPGLDRGDTRRATMTLALEAATLHKVPAKAHPMPLEKPPVSWRRGDFEADIEGVASSALGVSPIGLAIPRPPAAGAPSAKITVSLFHLTFEASARKSLEQWLAKGRAPTHQANAGSGSTYAPKTIRVAYQGVGKTGKVELFELTLQGCGPTSLTSAPTAAHETVGVDVGVSCTGVTLWSTAGL